ncbi:group II intron reverse transcriptase/maturase [Clostridium beijerinckii]|uniref:group II intron reverse transcriptase/maturase n=1 Tax=Clostridium beijerinckii TaxID=1520 RepID=UPI00232CC7D1|nr:group II intron reverse transcriptase/maturase [Clostridium beijerinckii]
MGESFKLEKRQSLRNNEYYTMQSIFDKLYEKSTEGFKFNNLMQYVTSRNNILLAYRNIKNNKGSTTCGTDKLDISFFKDMTTEKFVKRIQNKLANYTPESVRRVEIPKPNGKTRPLGIPCIEDRIIQQCIKQILEPICEAKFYKHSYGFRPNRSTEHAIARSMHLMNNAHLHYVVDIDIKGFFDNVNHSKLKKQIWNLGIQDKNLISIIGKILKSEIQGIGIPNKGTPQGGIISPLLSNIALNELDWWISSQWETFKTNYKYSAKSHKYRAIKKGDLKEIWLVRYADDFKIFCRDYKTAFKIFRATKMWLKERLDLDISTEKSKVTNLRKNYTEYLGFKLMVKPKHNKYVCQSRMCNKAKKITINKLKNQIKEIQKHGNSKEVLKLNSMILGMHNYYKCATKITYDFREINFLVTKTLEIRLKPWISNKPQFTETYKRLYGNYKGKIRTINGITMFPIYGCKTSNAMHLHRDICNYTKPGRNKIHQNLRGYKHLIDYLLRTANDDNTAELNDNRISLIAGQQGKCYVTGLDLEIGNMECHHKKQKCDGGTDEYKNLVWICGEAHKIVHCTKLDTIKNYLGLLTLDKQGMNRVNSLRKLVGNSVI